MFACQELKQLQKRRAVLVEQCDAHRRHLLDEHRRWSRLISFARDGVALAELLGGFVPQGHPTIAQRFNAGLTDGKGMSPVGTGETPPRNLLSSLRDLFVLALQPSVETLGYLHAVPPGQGRETPIRKPKLNLKTNLYEK